MTRKVRSLWAAYEKYNTSHPITVRGITGIGLFFIGDVLAQRIQNKKWDDGARTVRSCTWRAVVWAPTAHYFWVFLERIVHPRWCSDTFASLFVRNNI